MESHVVEEQLELSCSTPFSPETHLLQEGVAVAEEGEEALADWLCSGAVLARTGFWLAGGSTAFSSRKVFLIVNDVAVEQSLLSSSTLAI